MAKGMSKREKAVYNQIDKMNSRLEAIANRFGLESSIYGEYLNKVKSAFPNEKQTRVIETPNGSIIQIRNTQANRTDARGQHAFNEALQMPTVRQYEQAIKRDIARERGAETFGEAEHMAKHITKEEVNQYIEDKDLVKSYMEDGKLHYEEEQKDIKKALSAKGSKTYNELANILRDMDNEEGGNNAQIQEAQNANRVEATYRGGKAKIT